MGGSFQDVVQWTLQHGYWLMFIAMLVEGPAITAAGAFVAALGYFNVWIVLALSVLGNIVPDVIYYALGYWGRQKILDTYGHYFRVTKERLLRLEDLAKDHAWKALAIIKLFPLIATPGLIAVGSMRMPIKKYAWICLVITVPSSLFFLVIGYYFGALYDTIIKYVDYGGYAIIAIIVIFALTSFGWKKFSKRIAEKIEGGGWYY
jgi:membrane protein DedA with SNARE-associated domain